MAEFDPVQFVNRIGQRLVRDFEEAAMARHPGLVGAAREHPARLQLAKLLPASIAAGSGLVIDSYKSASRQQDIVLFERDLCPIYSVNDTPEATYYPIESVAAVGEIKSTVNKKVLFDALDNVRGAKKLKRHSEKEDVGLGSLAAFRKFGSDAVYAATPATEYSQSNNFRDQIFGFVLCHKFAQSPTTILDNLIEYQRTFGHEQMPNIIVSLSDGFIQGMKQVTSELQSSPTISDCFSFVPATDRAFSYLIRELRLHVRDGRSVPLQALDRYMTNVGLSLPQYSARKYEPRQ